MSNKKIIFTIILSFFGCSLFLYTLVHNNADEYWQEKFKDTIEYPLEKLSDTEDGEYWLIIENYDNQDSKAVINYTVLLNNKNNFYIHNSGSIYGTTANGMVILYKDGKFLDQRCFDSSTYYTYEINWGDLESHFIDYDSIDEKVKNEFFNKEKDE